MAKQLGMLGLEYVGLGKEGHSKPAVQLGRQSWARTPDITFRCQRCGLQVTRKPPRSGEPSPYCRSCQSTLSHQRQRQREQGLQ